MLGRQRGLEFPAFSARVAWLGALLILASAGCTPLELPARLPTRTVFAESNLMVQSDFAVPPQHRLLEQLPARKADLEAALGFRLNAEPIWVYLFADEAAFARYARQQLPGFADRRALFVKSDTRLMVLAHWQDQVGEDLRHELTHGYLHASLPWIPLWLDEGLAEQFELPPQSAPLHGKHLYHLVREFKAGRWQPGLERLESLEDPIHMGETQYAESWLWVHFLLFSSAERRQVFQSYVEDLRQPVGGKRQLSQRLGADRLSWELELLGHLKQLAAEQLAAEQLAAEQLAGGSERGDGDRVPAASPAAGLPNAAD